MRIGFVIPSSFARRTAAVVREEDWSMDRMVAPTKSQEQGCMTDVIR